MRHGPDADCRDNVRQLWVCNDPLNSKIRESPKSGREKEIGKRTSAEKVEARLARQFNGQRAPKRIPVLVRHLSFVSAITAPRRDTANRSGWFSSQTTPCAT